MVESRGKKRSYLLNRVDALRGPFEMRVPGKAGDATDTFTYTGRSQEFFFSLLGGANHTNLYKNLIKIQMFNVNLRTIEGPGSSPVSAPAHCRQLVSQEERMAADWRAEAEKKGAATHQKEVGVRLFINN